MIESHNLACEDPTHKHFKNPSFFFITPWNQKGYEYSLIYGSKIDVISPVWYEMGMKQNEADIWIEGAMNSTWL